MFQGMRDDMRVGMLGGMSTSRKHRFTVSLDDSARSMVEQAAAERDVPVATWLAHEARKAAIRQALAQPEPELSAEEAEEASEWRSISEQATSEHLARLDREGFWE